MRSLDGMKVLPRKDAATFEIDTRIYPLDAVLGAAYVFIDRAFVKIDQPRANVARVALATKRPLAADAVQSLCDAFANELLGQVLRERSSRRYGKLREVLLAKALFAPAAGAEVAPATTAPETPLDAAGPAPAEPSLSDLPDENADYLDDPYGIAVPWEDKYARKGEGGKKPGGAG